MKEKVMYLDISKNNSNALKLPNGQFPNQDTMSRTLPHQEYKKQQIREREKNSKRKMSRLPLFPRVSCPLYHLPQPSIVPMQSSSPHGEYHRLHPVNNSANGMGFQQWTKSSQCKRK